MRRWLKQQGLPPEFPAATLSLGEQQPLRAHPIPLTAYQRLHLKAPTAPAWSTASVHNQSGHHGDGITLRRRRLMRCERPATALSAQFRASSMAKQAEPHSPALAAVPAHPGPRCAGSSITPLHPLMEEQMAAGSMQNVRHPLDLSVCAPTGEPLPHDLKIGWRSASAILIKRPPGCAGIPRPSSDAAVCSSTRIQRPKNPLRRQQPQPCRAWPN